MQDLIPIVLIICIVLSCSLLAARSILRTHASAMNRPPLIHWVRLCLLALPIGAVFSALWIVPLLFLAPTEERILRMGYPYLLTLAATQTVIFIPIVSSFRAVASVILTTHTSGIP
jgi:hypothetical protein